MSIRRKNGRETFINTPYFESRRFVLVHGRWVGSVMEIGLCRDRAEGQFVMLNVGAIARDFATAFGLTKNRRKHQLLPVLFCRRHD